MKAYIVDATYRTEDGPVGVSRYVVVADDAHDAMARLRRLVGRVGFKAELSAGLPAPGIAYHVNRDLDIPEGTG